MNPFFKQLFTLVILCNTTIIALAATYYASPTGTGVGTINDPANITIGSSLLSNPGDTLFLRGGVYYFNEKQSILMNGNESARIAIMAYPGENPILDFSAEPYGSSYPGVSLHALSTYMHLKGLTIRYAGDNGLINNGSYHIIENCVFYGNCDSGLQHKNGGGNLIKNCDSFLNFDYQTGGVTAADFGGNADGFADKQYTSNNPNTYEGCRAWYNADDGWDFYQKNGNTIIKNCICYRNGLISYDLSNSPRLVKDELWFAQFPKTVTNADGGSNLVTLNKYTNFGNGNGFKLGGDYTKHDVILSNCLSVAHKKKTGVRGFDQNNNAGSMTLYNCAGYDNYYNYAFYNANTEDLLDSADLTIKNCVSLYAVSGGNVFSITKLETSNNSWLAPTAVTCNSSDYISIDSTVIISPRKVDGSLPNIVFMQLANGSDLIDKGVDVGLLFKGTAPDLGCFEKDDLADLPGAVTTPNNRNQGIPLGEQIENIVFKWGGGATRLVATNLPTGVTTITNDAEKTLTITGTPQAQGTFNYVVVTEGGEGNPATVNGKITVAANASKKIAYVTTLNNPADIPILSKLNANDDFVLTQIDAVTSNTYSNYDLVIVSPVPNIGSAGLPIIEFINKPRLLLKPAQLTSTRWNWGAPGSSKITSITVSNKAHEIFNGLTFTGANTNVLELVSVYGSSATSGITSFIGLPDVNILANVTGIDSASSIVEIPVGTVMNATAVNSRFIMIGLHENSMANLTPTALKLIENTCYYLLGMPVNVKQNLFEKDNSSVVIMQNNAEIAVETNKQISAMDLFNISGVKVNSSRNNRISISGLITGVYLLHIKGIDIDTVQKIIIQ